MSDPINRNYPNNEAVYQRRAGISRITSTPVENSLINPFYNLMLHQARPNGQAIPSSKPDNDEFSPGPSSTCPQYLPASDDDVAAFPAVPGNLEYADFDHMGSLSFGSRHKSVSQMIEELTDQLSNGWIAPDSNGLTRDPFPRNDSETRSQLFKALQSRNDQDMRKDSARVKQLVKFMQPDQLNTCRDENGKTALEIAVGKKDHLSIWRLVKRGASPSIDHPHSLQAIHVAVMRNDWHLTELLIKCRADINVTWGGEATPLFLAIQRGNDEIVELLANHGADVNVKSQGLTPLVWAIRNGSDTTVRLLVKNGARIDTCGEKNRNALMEAVLTGAWKGDRNVSFLLSFLRGANKSASLPFDINQQTVEGHTALSLAYIMHGQLRKRADEAEKDMQEIIFLLQGNGARTDFLLNRYDVGYGITLSEDCVQRAVRAGLGKEGDQNAKVAFIDAVAAFYDSKDTSYLSLLKNTPVTTRHEEKRDAIRKSKDHNQ
jgi:hypothetical protein